jgi:hypothetical protein
LKFVSRTIPQRGGYNIPQQAAEYYTRDYLHELLFSLHYSLSTIHYSLFFLQPDFLNREPLNPEPVFFT